MGATSLSMERKLPNSFVDSSKNTVVQSSAVRISDDMAAHMIHLFAQAGRAAKDSEKRSSRAVI